MSPLSWSQLLAAAVVPIVLVSAGGLLSSSLYHRFTAVVTRVRTLHRERIQYQEDLLRAELTGGGHERELAHRRALLGMLEAQTQHATYRANLARRALMLVLSAVGMELASSFTIALAVIWPNSPCGAVAAGFFLGGLVFAFAGTVVALFEMAFALRIIEQEGEFIAQWGKAERTSQPTA